MAAAVHGLPAVRRRPPLTWPPPRPASYRLPQKMCAEELKKGIMGVDPTLPSTITAFPPGYIDREKEVGAPWFQSLRCCRVFG